MNYKQLQKVKREGQGVEPKTRVSDSLHASNLKPPSEEIVFS